MTLMEVLKSNDWYRNLQVTNGCRRMIWDETVWIVYAREDSFTKTSVLVETSDEELAVKYLLYEEM